MGQYSLQDFNKIGNAGFELVLPERVVIQINELVKHVGSPNYIRTPVFSKTSKPVDVNTSKRGRDKQEPMSPSNIQNWERLKKFQATKIAEASGAEIHLNKIRSFLNKLTDKNSNEVTENIIEIINELKNEEKYEENMTNIGNIIFDIASTNRIFSKVYAEVYGTICSSNEFFINFLENQYNDYLNSYLLIEDSSPDEDYNAFCKNTKQNDKRRALSSFFLNLYCNGVMPIEKLQHIMEYLLNSIHKIIQSKEKAYFIDECTENVFILYSNELEYSTTLKLNNGRTIKETIEHYANTKSKTYPGMSSKCTFKYMDICGL